MKTGTIQKLKNNLSALQWALAERNETIAKQNKRISELEAICQTQGQTILAKETKITELSDLVDGLQAKVKDLTALTEA